MHLNHLVVIGSSAGGPRILRELFTGLPRLNGCIVIVQHMPAFINESLRKTLDDVTEMSVVLAEEGARLESGMVFIAPSEKHLLISKDYTISLNQEEKVHFVRPAVDVAMKSISPSTDTQMTGLVLTGMGKDGAEGLCHMKEIGALTIAQDEESSIIYGMPREAVEMGCVDIVLSHTDIHHKLIQMLGVQHPKQ